MSKEKVIKRVFDEAVASGKVSRYRVSQNGGHVAYYRDKSEATAHAKRLKQADKTDSIRVAHIRINPRTADDYMRHVALGEAVNLEKRLEQAKKNGWNKIASKIEQQIKDKKKNKKLFDIGLKHGTAGTHHPSKSVHTSDAYQAGWEKGNIIDDSGPWPVRGKMQESTKFSHPDHIQHAYNKNEDNNYHGKNVELLAKHYGSKEDQARAKAINQRHEARGHISGSDYAERSELHDKLYAKHIVASHKAKGVKINKATKDYYKSKGISLDEAHAGGSKRTTHITGRGTRIPIIEPIKGHEMKARLDSIAKAYGKKKPVKEETMVENKIPLKCNECGHHFKKAPRGPEAKCPKCKGYDTEFDYSYGGPKQQAAALRKTIVKESVCKHNMITKHGNCAACGINVKKHKEKIATAKAAMQKMIGTISRVGIREGFTDYKKAAHHLAVKHGPFNVTNAHIKAYIDSCDSPHKIDPEEIKAALRKKQRNITVPVREGLSPKVAKVVEAVKRNKKQA